MKYSNNPFNIRYSSRSNWVGLIGSKNGFCEFSSIAFSVRVFIYLVKKTYVKKFGKRYTLRDFINTYCPSGDGDNNPDYYVNLVYCLAKLHPDSLPYTYSPFQLYRFACAVCRIESSFDLSRDIFDRGYYFYLKH